MSFIIAMQDLSDKTHEEIKEIWNSRIPEEENDPKVLFHNSQEAEKNYHDKNFEEHNYELKQ